jgi:RNA polymerase sigma-70 factor, ECF subfamily
MAAKLTYDEVLAFYQQHGPALLAYGVSILGDKARAEDVLHHVFLNLLDRDKLPMEARPYLFKAVRNGSLNAMRGSARLTSLENQEWLVRPIGMVEAALEIEGAMGQLPPEQREVVVMKIWGEMTLTEVAQVLEIPENTVASRYRYALNKLREFLKDV